jgi:tetratricopeptide (TPR) repeat protein
MPKKLTGYKVFIASPGGLEDERRAFVKEIEEYNKIEAIHRDVVFYPVGWEDTLPGLGRPQSIINEELVQCDYFILVLHDRWGSHPGTNKMNASSGTEEEYRLAMECCNQHSMKQVICLFKSVPPNQLADPGPQLQKVLNFKRQIEEEKKLLYSNFSSIEEFQSLIRKNLAQWLRHDNAENKGGYLNPATPEDVPKIDTAGPESIETDPDDRYVQEMSKKAFEYAGEGKLVDAEIEFSKALIYKPTENQLINYASFLIDTGQLNKAMVMIDRAIHLANAGNNLFMQSFAYSYKGVVLKTWGDLDGAEEMFNKSLTINKEHGRRDGMAANYGSLGNILKIRGNLVEAEKMYKKSLAINEELGDLIGIAKNYVSLGNIFKTRGNLDKAEAMYKKGLAIDEKLGRQEEIATDLGNLGIIYQIRGELDTAEEMYKKALAIYEKLGHLESVANQYSNLGNILLIREDLEGAEEMHKKSLAINEKLGRLEGMAIQYGLIGVIYQNRQNLDTAEEMYKKALAINEKMGRLEGLASNYGNLGIVFHVRGDMSSAEEMYKKALALNERLGRKEGMLNQYGNLGATLHERGDLDGAEEMCKKALTIAEQMGLKQMKEKIKQLLKKIREDREGDDALPAQ